MENPIHLLLVAVVQDQDLDSATKEKEADALAALQEACRQRIEYMTLPLEGSPMPMPAPVPVTVGGATVFALPVERFEQI